MDDSDRHADPESPGVVSRAQRLDATREDETCMASTTRMLKSRLFWAKFWLVATGVWWGVCMQLLFYAGAGHPLAMLPNLDWYTGMMLVYYGRMCTKKSEHYAVIKQRHVLPIAFCDFLGTAGTTIGLELAGSAIFGIIFSSVTVWAALFTCVLLKKAQSPVRMLGIATVVAGLTLPTLDSNGESSEQGQLVLLGICLTFAGTLFYALEYTLCEQAFSLCTRARAPSSRALISRRAQHPRLPLPRALACSAAPGCPRLPPAAGVVHLLAPCSLLPAPRSSLPAPCSLLPAPCSVLRADDRPVDSKELCFFTGMWGLGFTLLWFVCYTIPKWQSLVSDEIEERGGSVPLIVLLFISHTINNGVHNYAWFVVCEVRPTATQPQSPEAAQPRSPEATQPRSPSNGPFAPPLAPHSWRAACPPAF